MNSNKIWKPAGNTINWEAKYSPSHRYVVRRRSQTSPLINDTAAKSQMTLRGRLQSTVETVSRYEKPIFKTKENDKEKKNKYQNTSPLNQDGDILVC